MATDITIKQTLSAEARTADRESLDRALKAYDKLQKDHGFMGCSAAEMGAFEAGWEARASTTQPTLQGTEDAIYMAALGVLAQPAWEGNTNDIARNIAQDAMRMIQGASYE